MQTICNYFYICYIKCNSVAYVVHAESEPITPNTVMKSYQIARIPAIPTRRVVHYTAAVCSCEGPCSCGGG